MRMEDMRPDEIVWTAGDSKRYVDTCDADSVSVASSIASITRLSKNMGLYQVFAVRSPADGNPHKCKGRSSGSSPFSRLPGHKPVAANVKTVGGTHSNGYCCRFSLHSLLIPEPDRFPETFARPKIVRNGVRSKSYMRNFH